MKHILFILLLAGCGGKDVKTVYQQPRASDSIMKKMDGQTKDTPKFYNNYQAKYPIYLYKKLDTASILHQIDSLRKILRKNSYDCLRTSPINIQTVNGSVIHGDKIIINDNHGNQNIKL